MIWRKSSYSNPNGACVETSAEVAGTVLVRDSRLGEGSPVLEFSPAAWTEFLTGIR
jgi:hypothetical protein